MTDMPRILQPGYSRAAARLCACLAGIAALLAGCATPPPSARRVPPVETRGASAPAPLPAVAGPLTVEQAVERALALSGQVAALRAAVAVADQERRAATAIADPELQLGWSQNTQETDRHRTSEQQINSSSVEVTRPEATAGSLRESTDRTSASQTMANTVTGSEMDDADGYRIGVRFFVPNPWVLGPRVAARRAALNAALADLAAGEWEVANQVRTLFAELHYRTNDVRLASELVRLEDIVAAAVRSRADQGQATLADRMQAMRRYLQALSDCERAVQRRDLAARALAALLNVPQGELSVDTSAMALAPPDVPAAAADRLQALALKERADLAAFQWRSLAARSAYREVRNERIPWLKDISGSYRNARTLTAGTAENIGDGSGSSRIVERNTDDFGQFTDANVTEGTTRRHEYSRTVTADSSDEEEWQVAAVINVPIFSWFNHAAGVALANLKLAEVNATEAARQAGRDVGDAYEELLRIQSERARYDAELQPVIDQMQTTLTNADAVAGMPPDEVAAIKAQIVESLRYRLESRYQHQAAAIALDRALGVPARDALAAPVP